VRDNVVSQVNLSAGRLAEQGGGEMKLTLHPEHLGEIQLKVSVKGEQVEVQMVADKPQVKQLLEQHLGDLKLHLSQHNLSMDRIDVSLNDRSMNEFNQNRQDLNWAREFAQQQNQQQSRNGDTRTFDDLNPGMSRKSSPNRSARSFG